MAKYYVGSDEVTKGWSRYYDLCNAFELSWTDDERPAVKTMNGWRVNSPKGFAFIPHVQPAVVDRLVALGAKGSTTFGDDEALLAPTLARAKALAAKGLLVSTPFDFTPTPTNRKLIADFAAQLRAAGFKQPILWENTGMWDPENSAELAASSGLTLLYNPWGNFDAEFQVLGGDDIALCLTERGGTRRHFDTYDMEQLVEQCDRFNRVFVLLRGQYKWRHARELKLLLDSLE